jgi:hypothetical protein
MTLARIVVFLQLFFPLNFLVETLVSPPGRHGMSDADLRARLLLAYGVAPVLIGLGLFAGLRMGPRRPWAWLGAILLHSILALLFAAVVYGGFTASAEQRPGAMVAIFLYSPIAIMSLVGLALLLLPPTVAYSRRGST